MKKRHQNVPGVFRRYVEHPDILVCAFQDDREHVELPLGLRGHPPVPNNGLRQPEVSLVSDDGAIIEGVRCVSRLSTTNALSGVVVAVSKAAYCTYTLRGWRDKGT